MKVLIQAVLLSAAFAGHVLAGDILFVNYNGSDNGVPAALAADAHNVTSVDVPPATANTYFQNANLGEYCAVVWSTAYAYSEDLSGASTILSNWAASGGYVLITTPDGIRDDGTLVGLLGGAGATDSGGDFSPVAEVVNSLTSGLFDIRGEQPTYISDVDALCSPLSADTVGLVTAERTGCSENHEEPGYVWSLRTLGSGQVASITSANFSSQNTDEPEWTANAIPGDGVYNAGLRNFAYAACTATAPASPIPTMSVWGLGILVFILGAIGFTKRRAM